MGSEVETPPLTQVQTPSADLNLTASDEDIDILAPETAYVHRALAWLQGKPEGHEAGRV